MGLIPFLDQEGISETQQQLLFDACKIELQPFTEDPTPLFSGSLDGQKIFDDLYTKKDLPASVRDEGLDSLYAMLFPRIATLLCRIPAAVKDWENNAWSENYKRLDNIAVELRQLFLKLDSVEERLSDTDDEFLAIARRSLAQRVSMELDLTGLRADKPVAGKMEDFFVHPEILTIDKKKSMVISSAEEAIDKFVINTSLAIVLGQPGSGKSTWTRWLQREALTTSWPGMAIRVELRQLDPTLLPSVQDFIRGNLSVHIAENVSADRVQTWINNSSLIFILDGFDEIAPANREPVISWIEDLRLAAGSCTILLTSRPVTTNHLEKLSPAWTRWNIEPFDDTRVFEYIRRWYAKVPLLVDSDSDVEPEQIFMQLGSDPTIGPLCMRRCKSSPRKRRDFPVCGR
ncbi:MAG: NACHT domain-containing protein, partial [Proteobacteria bacterium]|nr:NACHT domain-containing protein [Pseudomonadota bacterium]